MLTIAKMHGESVAYYESTVEEDKDENLGPDGYYSEDGTKPAEAWVNARTDAQAAAVAEALGVAEGEQILGENVRAWFNKAIAPSGVKLGRAPKESGVPGFDLTFCAPKSVSMLWGLTDDAAVRRAVDEAHAEAVGKALSYLSEHAGYTRRADEGDSSLMIIDRVEALSGVKYEHRTSRAGDPHVHSHVLLANKQRCSDGKWRTLDGVSLYHEARAAGMVYQAILRERLAASLGVEWGETVNGCAEMRGLEDRALIEAFSTRAREIDQWRAVNGLDANTQMARIGQKKTRQTKDLDTTLNELEANWRQRPAGHTVRENIADIRPRTELAERTHERPGLPTIAEIIEAVTEERSTFTRADVVEKTAELIPVGAVETEKILATVEELTEQVFRDGAAWTVTPDKSRVWDKAAREGSQRFTSQGVVDEVNRGIDLACAVTNAGVDASSIRERPGTLSAAQADAMRAVVSSRYRASVLIAPAGAGKTSSLKAARSAWENAGKQVIGLAPTGKASDVMVAEDVAHESMTLARALRQAGDLDARGAAAQLGWDNQTVVVVDEAGMVATPDIVRILDIAQAADARVVFVGDPYQYSAVKSRGGMLATLAHELPDAAELTEVFRQSDAAEREASKRLRTGEPADVERAADFYAEAGRLSAGSVTAMMNDALSDWKKDVLWGRQSLLVASNRDYVDALNAAAQKHMAELGELDLSESVPVSGGHFVHVGETILTRRNDYDLTTSAGDVVRNGQRWEVEEIDAEGNIRARRCDDTNATVTLPPAYLREHTQLGYASTGHSAQGATVDIARVVAEVSQIDRAGVYVPLTRGRYVNCLYMTETMPGDGDTGHGANTPVERRESTDYARDLLIQAATRNTGDITPHELHRKTRADWFIARLSHRLPQADPFANTRMGEVAQHRTQARMERFNDFHAEAQQAAERRKRLAGIDPKAVLRQHTRDKRTALDNRLTELGNLRDELKGQRAELNEYRLTLSNQERDAQSKVNEATREIEYAERARDNRGWLKKLFDPEAGNDTIAEWTSARDKRQQELDELRQRKEAIEAETTQIEDKLADIEREARPMEKEHALLCLYGEIVDPLVWKMVAPQEETEQTRLEDEAINEWLGKDGTRANFKAGHSTFETGELTNSYDIVVENGMEL